jgi:hypothetical protein
MTPRISIVTAGLVVAAVALATPTQAQSVRITVGSVFSAGPASPQSAPYPQPPSRALGRPGPDGGYGWQGHREAALNRGFSDGYEQGFDAARDRDRYDPRREGWYRNAARGYDRDYRLSRDEYRDIYRRGFLQGYESGYREGQREWRGRYRRPDGGSRQPQGGWSRNW